MASVQVALVRGYSDDSFAGHSGRMDRSVSLRFNVCGAVFEIVWPVWMRVQSSYACRTGAVSAANCCVTGEEIGVTSGWLVELLALTKRFGGESQRSDFTVRDLGLGHDIYRHQGYFLASEQH